MGKPESRAAYPLFRRVAKPRGACLATTGAKRRPTLQTKERRALPMYVTYFDLIQIRIFICAFVRLGYNNITYLMS